MIGHVEARLLRVSQCVEFTPEQHPDARGTFLEWFRFDQIMVATGRAFDLRQGNISVSKKGVLRGIHYSDVPRGQAKYVTVASGEVLDFVVDLRVGSPGFGTWDAVSLSAENRKAVFIPEGVGHAFLATSDEATVVYLASDVYKPTADRSVSALDPSIGLELPFELSDLILSEKDADAPTLGQARSTGALPDWEACLAAYHQAGLK